MHALGAPTVGGLARHIIPGLGHCLWQAVAQAERGLRHTPSLSGTLTREGGDNALISQQQTTAKKGEMAWCVMI
jgi:hypothetical protein